MDKLKYDSLYKFLVSLGVILITLPFAGLIYVANFKVTIIEQENYEKLSEYSRESLEQKQRLFHLIDRYSVYIIPVFFIVGLILLIIGGLYWFKMQRELDKQVVSDTKLKEFESQIKQMDASEILKKAIKEDEEEKSTAENEIKEGADTKEESAESQTAKVGESCLDNSKELAYKDESNYLTRTAKLLNSLKNIEKACQKIKTMYSQHYNVSSHVRIGRFEFDAVAISKNSNEDIIFEIKNYKVLAAFQTSSVYALLHEKEKYEEMNGRKCRLVYIFVSPQESIDNFMKRHDLNKGRYAVFSENNIEVEYWAEEDL